MFAACAPYALYATPMWLLALSAAAVTIGAVYVLRIMGHLGAPGVVAIATALAFVLNDNTARTLNYGFHPEVLYAWFIPWLLHAALTGQARQFAAAVIATILVKEDAVLPLVAASVALALNRVPGGTRMNRAAWLLCPIALAGLNLAAYYGAVIPALTSTGVPAYAHFWAAYGPTPVRALAGMAAEPLRLAEPPRPAGAIVVFAGGVGESGEAGGGYQERVKQAIDLYHAGLAPRLVFSSGFRFSFREAEVMKDVAVANGVPADAILLEVNAGSTYQNVVFVRDLLQGLDTRSALLVSSPYHMRRATLVWRKQAPQIDVIPAPVPESQFYQHKWGANARQIQGILHEYAAIAAYWWRGWL